MTFAGRDVPLASLVACLEEARAGRGSFALILGEPGVGKTALAEVLVARADAAILWGACLDVPGAGGLAPWRHALDTAVRRGLITGADPVAPILARLVPGLGATWPPVPLHPGEERVRLFDAVVAALRGLRPLVLVLDDLQWADPDTIHLLRHVLHFLPAEPWLIVATVREPGPPSSGLAELLGAVARLPRREYLALGGLDESATCEILAASIGQERARAETPAVHTETSGVPFYVCERARALAADDAGLPRPVRHAVGARIARLATEARALLDAASLVGGACDRDTLAEVAGVADADSALQEALESALLRAVDGGYAIAHAIVGRALQEAMPAEVRTQLRRRIADTLSRRLGDRAAATIAGLYHASRDLPGAEAGVPYARLAAEAAARATAHDRAADLLRMGVELGGRDLLEPLALAEAHAGRFEAATETARAVDAGPRFLAELASALKQAGARAPTWSPVVERGLRLCTDRGPEWARLEILRDRIVPVAEAPWHVSRWDGFDPRAVAILRATGAEGDFAATVSPFAAGPRVETDALLARAAAMAPGSARVVLLDAAIRGLVHRHADYGAALRVAQDLRDLGRRIGHLPAQAEAEYEIAKCHAILGDAEQARAASADVPGLVARLGPGHRLRFIALTALNLEIRYFFGGDWGPIADAATAFARAPATGRTPLGLIGLAFAALATALDGRRSEADAALVDLATLVARTDARVYQRKQAADLGITAAWHLGIPERAAAFLDAQVAARPDEGCAPITCTDLCLARIESLRGNRRAARRHWQSARAWALERGAAPLAAIVAWEEAIAAGARRGALDAQARAEAARAELGSLGMEPWRAAAEQELSARARVLPDGLTRREAEALALVAEGLANKEIAQRLRIGLGTAQRHLANAYAKIGVASRSQATAYVLRRDLGYMAPSPRST